MSTGQAKCTKIFKFIQRHETVLPGRESNPRAPTILILTQNISPAPLIHSTEWLWRLLTYLQTGDWTLAHGPCH